MMGKNSEYDFRVIRSQHFIFALLVVVAALVFSFLLAEIVVRVLFPFNTPDTVREHSMQYISSVYARALLKPLDRLVDLDNEKAWGSKSPEEPSDLRIFISANGYRGPSFQVRKPANMTRVIIIGGSAVFDQNMTDSGVDKENSWPNLVGKQLREDGFENIEVINAGIPGQTSADSLGRLFSQLWMYKPDVLLIYHAWNEIKLWKLLEITPERPLISHVPSYDPNSNPFMSYQGFWDELFSYSQLYVKVRNKYFMWNMNIGSEGVISNAQERADSYGRFGPEQFRLNMHLMVSACKILGITPILITQATLAVPDNS